MGWMYLASIVKVIAHVQCVGIEACHGILDGIIYVDCPNVMFLQFLPFGFCGKLGMFADARGVPRCICRKTPKIRKPKHLVTGATPHHPFAQRGWRKLFNPCWEAKEIVWGWEREVGSSWYILILVYTWNLQIVRQYYKMLTYQAHIDKLLVKWRQQCNVM